MFIQLPGTKNFYYIIFIAMAKCVHVPGKANQKNGLVESMKSITIIIVSHKKKYAQYFPVDLLASM